MVELTCLVSLPATTAPRVAMVAESRSSNSVIETLKRRRSLSRRLLMTERLSLRDVAYGISRGN